MNFVLAILCSPRANGVTDNLAKGFLNGVTSVGAHISTIALRDLRINACVNCGHCFTPPHQCVFASDMAEDVFTLFKHASLVVFASPIYFYGLPAVFKSFIDRGQKFWATKNYSQNAPVYIKPALSIMSAGRKKGKLLFTGALRTLSWFLKAMDAKIMETRTFYGLENVVDITPEIDENLFCLGEKWGKFVLDHI